MQSLVTAGAEAVRARLNLPSGARYEARLLAAGAGRAVVDYSFFPSGGLAAQAVIAKFYPDASGRHAHATMRAIGGALARRSGGLLALPRPLGYDARLRLLLQSKAGGEPLDTLARGPDACAALRQVGLALAELHQLRLPVRRVLRLRDHLADLVRPHPRALAAYAEALGTSAQVLLEALLAAEARIDIPGIAAPVHRDFHLRQLFAGAGRIWLIDWDLFGHGDPALDIGNFCVYLLTHLDRGAAQAVDAFLSGYRQAGQATAIGRAPLYAAFTCLRLACKRARQQQPGWRAAADRLLTTGLRVLQEDTLDAWSEPAPFHSGAIQ
jgi:streptomycin 6-kinase